MAPSCDKKNAVSCLAKLVLEQKLECIYTDTAESSYQYVVVTEETEHMYPLLLRCSLKSPKRSAINSYLSTAYDVG